MLNFEIISPKDFDSLPENPEERFVAFEEICRRNMTEMISNDTHESFDRIIATQYMTAVAAAAAEYSIEGIEYPDHLDDPYQGLNYFMLKASGVVTRFRLRASRRRPESSVQLASKTRGKIEQQIQRLRFIIMESDLPDNRQSILLKKLDELSVELSQSRLSFVKAFSILSCVSVGVTAATGFLADAPDALTTITQLIGADKEAEDAEVSRLGAPAKPILLPQPAKILPAPQRERFGRKMPDLDDGIPF